MFYYYTCAKKNNWPSGFPHPQSRGPCEVCDKTSVCTDVPSRALPEPKKQTFCGQEMVPAPEWRDDAHNAPREEWLLTFGQGGISLKMMAEYGQWRGKSGLCEQRTGELGRPRAAPSHWMLLPDPPFAPLGKNPPGKGGEDRKRKSEGLAGAI